MSKEHVSFIICLANERQTRYRLLASRYEAHSRALNEDEAAQSNLEKAQAVAKSSAENLQWLRDSIDSLRKEIDAITEEMTAYLEKI